MVDRVVMKNALAARSSKWNNVHGRANNVHQDELSGECVTELLASCLPVFVDDRLDEVVASRNDKPGRGYVAGALKTPMQVKMSDEQTMRRVRHSYTKPGLRPKFKGEAGLGYTFFACLLSLDLG